MNKIFLSHSSADKQYVSQIADKFGKDIAVYDEYSFEEGMKAIDEIFRGIQNSDIFVVFLSDSALNSEWVSSELSIAHEKLNDHQLKMIFPIIIDPNLEHSDKRIPEWMRTGEDSYNLQYIGSPKLAYKKIKNRFSSNENYYSDYKIYVGHEDLLKQFDENYYLSPEPCKCIIACGIEGIGREAFIRECIKVPKTFATHYEPNVISLQKNDSIDDVILKLMDTGFGESVSLSTTTKINTMEFSDKIGTLSYLLNEAQKYKEFVILRDQSVLIKNGEVEWWFLKALEGIRPELTIGIVSDSFVNKRKDTRECYIESINELDNSEKLKLLDKLSQENGLSLDREDVKYFLNILTGHPRQIIFCIQKIKAESLEEVKHKSSEICDFVSKSTIRLIDKYIGLLNYNEEQKTKFVSYLAFLANYSNIPVSEVLNINELDPDYTDFYYKLISFCICRRTGMNNDVITTSPSVVDYIDRNRIGMPEDIDKYLKEEYNGFKEYLKTETIDDYCYSQIERNLKELVIENGTISGYKYIFPSIILKAVIQLYNKQSYDKVISIAENCSDSLAMWDHYIRQSFVFYYAMTLARRKNHTVLEVICRRINSDFILEKFQAEYVKGFYYKLVGRYEDAAHCFKQCLDDNNKYFRASRELVETYINLERYDTAKELSALNYQRFPDNIFNIFQYFKCIVFSKVPESDLLAELLQKAKEVDSLSISSKMFYPNMRALYALIIEKNSDKALRIMEENARCFDNKILYYKDIFDIYMRKRDVANMELTLTQLKAAIDNDKCFLPIQIRRECILSYFKNHDLDKAYNIVRVSTLSRDIRNDIIEFMTEFVEKEKL